MPEGNRSKDRAIAELADADGEDKTRNWCGRHHRVTT